jgi:hypothetical protein
MIIVQNSGSTTSLHSSMYKPKEALTTSEEESKGVGGPLLLALFALVLEFILDILGVLALGSTIRWPKLPVSNLGRSGRLFWR